MSKYDFFPVEVPAIPYMGLVRRTTVETITSDMYILCLLEYHVDIMPKIQFIHSWRFGKSPCVAQLLREL